MDRRLPIQPAGREAEVRNQHIYKEMRAGEPGDNGRVFRRDVRSGQQVGGVRRKFQPGKPVSAAAIPVLQRGEPVLIRV